MATELTTIFMPIISEDRMSAYSSSDFQLSSRSTDSGIDIRFTPLLETDNALFMIAPGEVFFIAAGTTVIIAQGAFLITAPIDKNTIVIHVLKTNEWSPILANTGQPTAEWWALEGITQTSFEAFLDSNDLNALASSRRFSDGTELRTAILNGSAGINVLLQDKLPVVLGNLTLATDNTVTMGLRTWTNYDIGLVELDALSTLFTIKQLAPTILGPLDSTLPASESNLPKHPLLALSLANILTQDITIHVRFVYWEANTINSTRKIDKGYFQPIHNGSKIALQKLNSSTLSNTTIAEATVASNGQVALVVPRTAIQGGSLTSDESLAFRLEVPNNTVFVTQYQHEITPRENDSPLKWEESSNTWITAGFSTTDNEIDSLDFLMSLESTTLGTSEQPIEYYAGIPIFIQIQYPVVCIAGSGSSAKFISEIRNAPKGILIDIRDSSRSSRRLGKFFTDEHGQIWGMLTSLANRHERSTNVLIEYEITDPGINLLTIKGEVFESGKGIRQYDSSKNPINAAKFSAPITSSIGKPTLTDLVTIQVGFITIDDLSLPLPNFSSQEGRHAGVMHALQQIRYIHQWFHYLTLEYKDGTGVDQSWDAVLARHNGGLGTDNAGTQYAVLLPQIRVQDTFITYTNSAGDTIRDETVFGAADLNSLSIESSYYWRLTLYGHDSFSINSQLAIENITKSTRVMSNVILENKVQFWRDHTIWHEFTHVVLNMAIDRLFNIDTHSSLNNAKNALTSSQIDQPIGDGWSTLEEAIAAIPEVALLGKTTGITLSFSPSDSASPRYMKVNIDTDGDGIADMLLKNGITAVGVLDWRLGLRVPQAFTWGLWTALERLAGFKTLYETFRGSPQVNDLKNKTYYLNSLDARTIFQALVWGPLVSLKTPQTASGIFPPQWDDLNGAISGFIATDPQGKGAAGPLFGDSGSRRIRINGPSTHRFMELIQQQFWNKLTVTEQDELRILFGDVDDFPGMGDVSFYLWFDF